MSRLIGVISLQNRDEMARKNARRKFTRLILNDFVMNPGADMAPLGALDANKGQRDYGLMTPFIHRWLTRLPEALASAAGADVRIPPGNSELHEWLGEYQTSFAES
jgi:hypothetical protein